MNSGAITNIARTLNCLNFDADEKLNSDATWTVISCPLAPFSAAHNFGRDAHPSFSVNCEPGASVCKCFSCGFVGPIEKAVKEVFEHGGLDKETMMELLKFITVESQRNYLVEETVYVPSLPAFFTDYFYRMHPYIEQRGLDEQDMAEWGLGYSDDVERILIPFYEEDGTLMAVIGRDVTGESELKYMIYPKSFPRSRYLFGETKLSGEEDAVLVVEGYLDCIMARKYLPENIGVVAIGTAIPSDKQLRQLLALAPEIVLGLDNPEKDGAGLEGYEKAKKALRGRCKLSELDYRQFKDAGEAGEKIALIVEHRTRHTLTNALSDSLEALRKRLTGEEESDTME